MMVFCECGPELCPLWGKCARSSMDEVLLAPVPSTMFIFEKGEECKYFVPKEEAESEKEK